jgi:hypothetical protein
MILVLAIILFIIFLIYSIRPSKSEEYTLEGLKLSWVNKASIEGVVTKWIVTLKDSSGSVIHTYENSDAGNLKDFTDVTMNIVNNKEFDEKIIGDNTLELYYNEVKPDTKLYTKTVTFTEDDFGMSLDTSNLEEIDIPPPPPPPPPPAQPTLSLRTGNSGAQADGRGAVYYLDRHNIDCGSDALNQFTLTRPTGDKTQYNFSCLKPLNLQTEGTYTPSGYKGGHSGRRSSALYLDRHDVNCHDKPITQFGLKRSGTRRIKYEYKCGNVEPSDVTCRNTSTPWNQESNSVHYLDRHNVKCNSDEYISKFKLNRDGGGKFRYDYKCCKKK